MPNWEVFSESDIPEFVREGTTVFKRHLDAYLASSGAANPEREQRLMVMLESLLHARQFGVQSTEEEKS
jgi:hypothetical protein